MSDFSYLLNLQKIGIPEISGIKRIPDIEELKTEKYGKLYAVKYFLFMGTTKRMIRFTSKDRSFKELFSIDIFDNNFKPVGIRAKFIDDKEKFLSMLGKSILKFNKSILHEMDAYRMLIATVFVTAFAQLALNQIFKFISWSQQKTTDLMETDIDKTLFSGQKEYEPAYAIYGKLISYIKNVISGPVPALIICGRPGTSKTYIVRRTLYFQDMSSGKDFNISKGASLGLRDTYYLLYQNKDKILVLDDFDSPLKDPDMVNFLKSITDSYKHRILSLPREKALLAVSPEHELRVPDKFNFTGKLIIITNLSKHEIDRALLSRAPAIEIDFDTKKVINSLTSMMKYISPSVDMDKKMEVYNYIISLYEKNPDINVNFRGFQNAIDARIGLPDHWHEMVRTIVEYE